MKKRSFVFVAFLVIIILAEVGHADSDPCSDAVNQGKFRDAVTLCTKQIEGSADAKIIHDAYRYRGIAYVETGKPDLAIADFNKTLEINPNDDEAYNDRGAAYLEIGKIDFAIADYNKSIQLNPSNSEPYRNRGAANMAADRLDAARADYSKALELNSADSRGYYNMACLHSLQKNAKEACSWLQKAIDHGYSNWDHVKQDSDLVNVREAECYLKIMNDK